MTVPTASLPYSRRSVAIAQSMTDLAGFQTNSTWARRKTEPGISDFTFGNPHEMPLAGAFFGAPGYFRISLTASEEMIERSLRIFAVAWHEATAREMGAVAAG